MKIFRFETDDAKLARMISETIIRYETKTTYPQNQNLVDGTIIRPLRKEAKLTQKQLSVLSGVHEITITKIERGLNLTRPQTLERLRSVCEKQIELNKTD